VGLGLTGKSVTGKTALPQRDNPGISESEADAIRRNVAKKLEEAFKGRGDMPGGYGRWVAEELKPPTRNWRREFKNLVSWGMRKAFGQERRTYKKPNARRCASSQWKIIYPSTYTPIPKVALVQDTSGSMSDQAIQDSLSEVQGILRTLNAEISSLTVIVLLVKHRQSATCGISSSEGAGEPTCV
jgi:predicted metal-dependent peptidase